AALPEGGDGGGARLSARRRRPGHRPRSPWRRARPRGRRGGQRPGGRHRGRRNRGLRLRSGRPGHARPRHVVGPQTLHGAAPQPAWAWIPARDWGRRTLFPVVRFGGSSDVGVVGRVGLITTGYGFRKYPYADHQSLNFSYATGRRAFGGDYAGRFPFENSRL